MKTVMENILDLVGNIKVELNNLIIKHSSLHLSRLNSNRDIVFIGFGDYFWDDLTIEGKRQQDLVYKKYEKFSSLCKTLLHRSAPSKRDEFQRNDLWIREIIQQNKGLYKQSTELVLDDVFSYIDTITNLLNSLFSAEGEFYLIPDTNALYESSDLGKWQFGKFQRFTIVLSSTILSELDDHKLNHKNPDVRKKAKSLIRQIKEFRSRGNLTYGVPIVNERVYLKSLAIEPDMSNTFPGLVSDCRDDRFLASVLEYMCDNTRSYVYIVTNDINMQNKAEFACLPFIESPEILLREEQEE